MVGFPFSAEDWFLVQEAARATLNATFAEDSVLYASHFAELCFVLTELKTKYGNHPVLLETEADFSDDPKARRELYQEAIHEAEQSGLMTYSIRIALARVLLEDFGEHDRALAVLLACEEELSQRADEQERREWSELADECRQHTR